MGDDNRITKTADVCGGDACIRGTRIPVWGLIESRRLGMSDDQILATHPALTQADLNSAWRYFEAHQREIERALWENESCMIEHDGRNVPFSLLSRGRELGFTDAEIRSAFEPALEPGAP